LFVSNSYGRLVQVISGSFYDGFGTPIAPPTNESSSYAISASYAASASYAITGSYALAGSGSFMGSFRGYVSASYIDFDTSWNGIGFPPHREGRVFYETLDHSLTYYNEVTNMSVQLGQETVVRVRNGTGEIIPDGTPVKITGAQGNRPKVELAFAHINDPSTTMMHHGEILGVTTHDIPKNGDGYVTVRGIVRGINTSAWGEGDILYVSQSAGQLTNIMPPAPYCMTEVGIVAVAGVNGQIYVDPHGSMHLENISNVNIDTWPHDKDILIYRSSSQYWSTGSIGEEIRSPYRMVSSSYTITLFDGIVEVITPYVTASLPTAVGNIGKEFSVINATTGSIMILASGSQKIVIYWCPRQMHHDLLVII
jgi:hypothetical protein